MSTPAYRFVKAERFSVGDAEPVERQAAITAATATYDADVVNAIIAALVAFGLLAEEE